MEPNRTDTEYDPANDMEATETESGTATFTDHLTNFWEQVAGSNEATRGGLDGVFSPSFMREHTQYESFREFATESHWNLEIEADIDEIPIEELDQYVAETTQFSSWDAMVTSAAEDDLFEHYTGVSIEFERD